MPVLKSVNVGARYVHHRDLFKEYIVVGFGRLQLPDPTYDMQDVVFYSAPGEEAPWVRLLSEFIDGRFQRV